MKNRKEYRAAVVEKKKLIKELFWKYQDGELDNYCRILIRGGVRIAKRDGKINGNVFDISEIQRNIAYIRDLAARSTPDGELLAFTRAEIEEYWRSEYGVESMNWNNYFGLDKKRRP